MRAAGRGGEKYGEKRMKGEKWTSLNSKLESPIKKRWFKWTGGRKVGEEKNFGKNNRMVGNNAV